MISVVTGDSMHYRCIMYDRSRNNFQRDQKRMVQTSHVQTGFAKPLMEIESTKRSIPNLNDMTFTGMVRCYKL